MVARARAAWHLPRPPAAWYITGMPWDPMRDLRAWQERLERLSNHRAESWTPPIDVYEAPDRYVIAAEVPGLTREQIELALEDSRLTIRGQRAERPASGGDIVHYHQVE